MRDLAERGRAVAAVHQRRDRQHAAAAGADDVDRLLHAPAARHDVLRDDARLARLHREAAHGELPVLLLGEDALLVEGARNLVADEDAAERGRDDGRRLPRQFRRDERRERRAERFRLAREAQQVRALEELRAVEPRAQFEMAAQQRAGLLQDAVNFFFGHGRILRSAGTRRILARRPRARNRAPPRAR